MYLAGFGAAGDRAIAQGLVELPPLPALPEDLGARWRAVLGDAIRGLDRTGYRGVGVRVTLVPGSELRRALLVAVPRAREEHLRRWMARLTRLETLVPDSLRLPIARAQYDEVVGDFPAARCHVAPAPFRVGGSWIACSFRVLSFVGSLMEEADAYGYRFGYHLDIRPLVPGGDQVRRARRNALTLSELPGIPQALVDMQDALARNLMHSRAVIEELVAVDPGEPEEWLLGALRGHFERSLGHLGFEAPDWEIRRDGFDDELATPVLDIEPDPDDAYLCASALRADEVSDALSWQPPRSLATWLAAPYRPEGAVDEEMRRVVIVPGPAATTGARSEPFFFVSYRRSDLASIVPVLDSVSGHGWNLWYDCEIAGGSEWHAVLEERLVACRGVLAFVSQSAVDSKYVRRELLLADTLDKPIVAVQLGRPELRHGLRMLLTQYQMLSYSAPGFSQQLAGALSRLAPL